MEYDCIFFKLLCAIASVLIFSNLSHCKVINNTKLELIGQNKHVASNSIKKSVNHLITVNPLFKSNNNTIKKLAAKKVKHKENKNKMKKKVKHILVKKIRPQNTKAKENIPKKDLTRQQTHMRSEIQIPVVPNTDDIELAKFIRKGSPSTNKPIGITMDNCTANLIKSKNKTSHKRRLNINYLRSDEHSNDLNNGYKETDLENESVPIDLEINGVDTEYENVQTDLENEDIEEDLEIDLETVENVDNHMQTDLEHENVENNIESDLENVDDGLETDLDSENVGNDLDTDLDNENIDTNLETDIENEIDIETEEIHQGSEENETGNETIDNISEDNIEDNTIGSGDNNETKPTWPTTSTTAGGIRNTKCSTAKPLPELDASFRPTSDETVDLSTLTGVTKARDLYPVSETEETPEDTDVPPDTNATTESPDSPSEDTSESAVAPGSDQVEKKTNYHPPDPIKIPTYYVDDE